MAEHAATHDEVEEMKKELENTSFEDIQLMKGLIEQEIERRRSLGECVD